MFSGKCAHSRRANIPVQITSRVLAAFMYFNQARKLKTESRFSARKKYAKFEHYTTQLSWISICVWIIVTHNFSINVNWCRRLFSNDEHCKSWCNCAVMETFIAKHPHQLEKTSKLFAKKLKTIIFIKSVIEAVCAQELQKNGLWQYIWSNLAWWNILFVHYKIDVARVSTYAVRYSLLSYFCFFFLRCTIDEKNHPTQIEVNWFFFIALSLSLYIIHYYDYAHAL